MILKWEGMQVYKIHTRGFKQCFSSLAWKPQLKDLWKIVDVCKQAKMEGVPYPGLLQPLPIPEGIWKNITMKFVERLPESIGKNAILVIVDRFTKYEHFLAVTHPFTAQDIAQLFLEHVYNW